MLKQLERRPPFRRVFTGISDIEKIIMLSCFFSLSMVVFRVLYTEEQFSLFLVWNLFLGFIPYLLSSFLYYNIEWIESNKKFIPAAIVWLLFIPNSFYIITDLLHLKPRFSVPLWYDLMLLLSFAWNGILFGILSIRQMEKIFLVKWKVKTDLYFIYPVMFLNALGVYIGRYMRFNSWDVVTNPFQLIADILYLFRHPIPNRFDWSMILCYSFFMTLVYITMKKLRRSVF
jgi:uncharacterized membrane protein